MNSTRSALQQLFDRIPRRHTVDNVKEIYSLLDDYEIVLQDIEGENSFYEQHIAQYFDALESIRAVIKKSADNKASKKLKDQFFDEASGNLKDSIEELMEMYANGSRTE